ncbi:DUF2264 domain-containing protein [Cellulomonas humilata]|uniref:DUF2264 domain-containing protein n=1 Tax=Cellulomonas humilata TaxID=144055 RepID=A0A7Y6A4Z2_9CELL|nr:DUF2264 domain-containing protein [Cellulomonas humilata]
MTSTTPALPTAGPADHTRWVELADALLRSTRPFASSTHALLRLPGPASASGAWSDGLEGYARTFLLAAFRVRGADGADPHGHLERYAAGLRHGVDRGHAERWPGIPERRQAIVEAASVAVALSETRLWLWDRLDDTTRARTVDWMADIVGTSGYRNNWLWFQNVVESFLREVGGPWSQEDLDRNDALQEDLYVGDGWYSDGRGAHGRPQTFDYYAGWAWHLYPLLRARIEGRPLERVHAERLHAYLEGAQHLVGSDGAPVLHGRSATYRFGMLAPFWAGALAGATPLQPGQTRALASAVVDHFLASGAVDDQGMLSIGWHRPFTGLRQLYSGGASPYWASKGFLGLLLGPDHPVWTDAASTPPAWEREAVTLLRAPGWLVVSTPQDGTVRLLNHGSDRVLDPPWSPRADDPFYARLGYSNHTSPQLAPDAIAAPEDSHVALLDERGEPSHRDAVERLHLADGVAVSRSRTHWLTLPTAAGVGAATWAGLRAGPHLVTASVVRGHAEVRLAWWEGATDDVDGGWPRADGPFALRVGGWALAAERADDLSLDEQTHGIRVRRLDGAGSLVRGLRGLDVAGSTARHGADPLGAASVTPWVRSSGAVPAGHVVAALVVLAGAAADVEPTATVRVRDARAVEVSWPDGHVDVVHGEDLR